MFALCESFTAMNLIDYLDKLSTAQRRDFATRCKIKDLYLAQLKCSAKGDGERRPSVKLCRRFVAASAAMRAQAGLEDTLLTLEELRPDVWGPQVLSESAA